MEKRSSAFLWIPRVSHIHTRHSPCWRKFSIWQELLAVAISTISWLLLSLGVLPHPARISLLVFHRASLARYRSIVVLVFSPSILVSTQLALLVPFLLNKLKMVVWILKYRLRSHFFQIFDLAAALFDLICAFHHVRSQSLQSSWWR